MEANVKSPVKKYLILPSDCRCLYMYTPNHADLNLNFQYLLTLYKFIFWQGFAVLMMVTRTTTY